MATADQLKALIQSHAEGDEDRFFSIATQVAAQEARNGHTRFAQELRGLIDKARAQIHDKPPAHSLPIPIAQPRGDLVGLLSVSYPKQRLSLMALDEAVSRRIRRVLVEQRHQDRLNAHGLSPLRKLLLVGPPGTGKTMTAGVLAGELDLPLLTIQLDGLITKFMGETAAKLRLVFDSIQQTRAVYLFDEFDAVGAERAARNDVGEIRRILNSFLQFLEHDQSRSLILCATNHSRLLDRALYRRFDAVIEYLLPTAPVVLCVMQARLALFDSTDVDWPRVVSTAEGLSHAELVHACEQAAKNTILAHNTSITTDTILEAVNERKAAEGR